MKVDDYGKKVGQLRQEQTKAIKDLEEDHKSTQDIQAKKYNRNLEHQQKSSEKQVERLSDRFESTAKKMSDDAQERVLRQNELRQKEADAVKNDFVKTNGKQRENFNERIQDLGENYQRNLEEKDDFYQGKLATKDTRFRQIRDKDESRHRDELEGITSSTQKEIKESEGFATRKKVEQDQNHTKGIQALKVQNNYESGRDREQLAQELRTDRTISQVRADRQEEDARTNQARRADSYNRRLEEIESKRAAETEEIQGRFTQERRAILDQTQDRHQQNVDSLKKTYEDRLFSTESTYREGLQLRDIENNTMKARYEEKTATMQKQFEDELIKRLKFQDQKLESERESMRREAMKRDMAHKDNINGVREQFNKEIAKQRQKSATELSELTNRYEEHIRNLKDENARGMDKARQDHQVAFDNLAHNSKLEKQDMVAYYEDRLRSVKSGAATQRHEQASQRAPKA